MRIRLSLTKNQEVIPFNYRDFIKHWFHCVTNGDKSLHEGLSLYSISGLQNTQISDSKKGFNCLDNSYFEISAHDNALIFQIMRFVESNPELFCGIKITDINIINDPIFYETQRFRLGAPILIRKNIGKVKTYFKQISDEANYKIQSILVKKMEFVNNIYKLKNGKDDPNMNDPNMKVYFDSEYNNFKTKPVLYQGIRHICIECPVIITGKDSTKLFAWNVGIGQSTGSGFGFLN